MHNVHALISGGPYNAGICIDLIFILQSYFCLLQWSSFRENPTKLQFVCKICCVVCRMNKLTTSEFGHGQTDRQTTTVP